jgi:tRNA(Ile)-lysidine synthase
VAVSGGSDSLALAILADRWARERGGRICALTVDHRLRPESADEAHRLQGWLTAREIHHAVLVWRDAKPSTGIEAAAREARYQLLGAWCRDQGCLHLLTAHHREDQAETYLIRRRAHSGPDGLAGMSAVRELANYRLLRPLLAIEKARLAALLAAERQSWISDPSNLDPIFERARLRLGGGASSAGSTRAAARDAIRERGLLRQLREGARDALLARAAMLHPAGFGALDPALLRAAPTRVADRALAALVRTIGGASYAPRRERLARLRSALAGEKPDAAGRVPGYMAGRTLAGCRFVAWRDRVLILREAAAAADPVRLTPGSELLWDRRFRLALAADATEAFLVGYLRSAGVAELDRRTPAARQPGLPRLLYPLLPAVWDRAGLAAVPALGYQRGGIGRLPDIILRPVNCLAGGRFVVVSRPAHLMCSIAEDARGPSPIGVR